MMEETFVTQAGYDALLREKADLVAALRIEQTSKGRAAAGDSNSWHDNAEYDLHARNEMILAQSVAQIMERIGSAVIIGVPDQNDLVAIGHVITLRSLSGEEKYLMVAGFGETDLNASPQKVSYDAPIVQPFFRQRTGYVASILVKGQEVEYELIAIA